MASAVPLVRICTAGSRSAFSALTHCPHLLPSLAALIRPHLLPLSRVLLILRLQRLETDVLGRVSTVSLKGRMHELMQAVTKPDAKTTPNRRRASQSLHRGSAAAPSARQSPHSSQVGAPSSTPRSSPQVTRRRTADRGPLAHAQTHFQNEEAVHHHRVAGPVPLNVRSPSLHRSEDYQSLVAQQQHEVFARVQPLDAHSWYRSVSRLPGHCAP